VEVEEFIYDETGRQIKEGDYLRLFHFTGPRNKKYYMYKYVTIAPCGPDKMPRLYGVHSCKKPDEGYFLYFQITDKETNRIKGTVVLNEDYD